MIIYRICEGNGIDLHVVVRKRDISRDYDRLTDYDLNEVTNLRAELVSCYDTVTMKADVTGVSGNEVVCTVPGTLEADVYDLRLSWDDNGVLMQSMERRVLQVVTHNGSTRMPIGLQDGEPHGLFEMRYYVVTENQSQCSVTYILDNVECKEQVKTLRNGERLEAELEAEAGFGLGKVQVVMDGVDITAEVCNAGHVDIPAVSGWVTIVAKGSATEYYYGASASGDVAGLDLDTLEKVSGSAAGKTLSIETTDTADRVWVVSRVELTFMQGGMAAAMHSRRVGDLWYYWSDELTAGVNEYVTKLKR